MSQQRLILHPSDFSPASRPSFAQAIASAKEHRAALLVIHVLAPVILRGFVRLADLVAAPIPAA